MFVNQFEKNCGGPAVFSKDSSTEPVPHNLTDCVGERSIDGEARQGRTPPETQLSSCALASRIYEAPY